MGKQWKNNGHVKLEFVPQISMRKGHYSKIKMAANGQNILS